LEPPQWPAKELVSRSTLGSRSGGRSALRSRSTLRGRSTLGSRSRSGLRSRSGGRSGLLGLGGLFLLLAAKGDGQAADQSQDQQQGHELTHAFSPLFCVGVAKLLFDSVGFCGLGAERHVVLSPRIAQNRQPPSPSRQLCGSCLFLLGCPLGGAQLPQYGYALLSPILPKQIVRDYKPGFPGQSRKIWSPASKKKFAICQDNAWEMLFPLPEPPTALAGESREPPETLGHLSNSGHSQWPENPRCDPATGAWICRNSYNSHLRKPGDGRELRCNVNWLPHRDRSLAHLLPYARRGRAGGPSRKSAAQAPGSQ